jgi:hypothetical protein
MFRGKNSGGRIRKQWAYSAIEVLTMNETYGMFRLHHSIHAIAANGKNSYSY